MTRFWEFAQLTDGWRNASYFDEVPLPHLSHANSSSGDRKPHALAFEKVSGKLYIGGIATLYQEPSRLKAASVKRVVSLLDWEVDEEGRRKVREALWRESESGDGERRLGEKWLRINVEDDEKEDLARWFEQTNRFIEEGLRSGEAVFVHCAMGVSRSATVVCAYLMWKFGLGRNEALEWLRKGRARCAPNARFWEQLEEYEGILKRERPVKGKL